MEQRKNEQQQVFSIGDFGTADGIRSFPLIEKIIGLVTEEMKRNCDFIIFFEDQPRNDFQLLFKALEDKQESSNHFAKNVYTAAVGKSMFSQCLPSNSLDILFSTATVHWLSNPPIQVRNGAVYAHADELELTKIRESAERDWNNFVVARGKELKPGSCMVVQVASFLPEDDKINFFIPLSTAWQRAYKKKIINETEFTETTINTYPARTLQEVIAPFDQSKEDQGLVLLSHERKYHHLSGIVEKEKDRVSYADLMVQYLTPWVRNTIFCGLSDNRSLEEKNKICDSYFKIVWDMAHNGGLIVKHIPYIEVVAMKKDTF